MVYDHLGNPYKTVREMCKHYNITVSAYNGRKRLNWTLQEILEGKENKVYDHLGNPFNSVNEMCKHYNITARIYNHRLELGMTQQDALTLVKSDYQYKKVADHTGERYINKSDMCKHWGISLTLFNNRIKSGMTLKEALETPIQANAITGISCTDHKGIYYESKSKMCRAYGIDIATFISRINSGMSLKDALETPVLCINNRIDEVKDHLGHTYATKDEMCEHYGISYGTFSARLRRGWTLKDALTTSANTNNIKIKIFGNEYNSISEAEKKLNLPNGTLLSRMKDSSMCNNFDMEILALPLNLSHVKLVLVGLDGQARYRVPWAGDLQTTRQVVEHERPDLLDLYDKAHQKGEYNPYRIDIIDEEQ